MTTTEDDRAPVPGPAQDGVTRAPRSPRRSLLAVTVRVFLVTVLSFALYALAPLGRRPDASVAAELAACLMVLAAVVAWQIRAVTRSSYPGLRAAEAVAVSVPLLVLLFASAYFAIAQIHPVSFTQPLTRIDAVYFTVTVLATVGFGDISAVTETARILVTIQMFTDLVLIGIVAKVLFGAVQQRRHALSTDSTQPLESLPAMPE
jgi:hypothetical protein